MARNNVEEQKHVNIKDFILEKYTPAKLSENFLETLYVETSEKVNSCDGTESASSISLTALEQIKIFDNAQTKCPNLIYPFSKSSLQNAAIKSRRVLSKPGNHNKTIYELQLENHNLEWCPGDTIAILPSNPSRIVDNFLELMDLSDTADSYCKVKVLDSCTKKLAKVPPHIPEYTTPRAILRDCLNLNAVLKKQFIRTLAEYCSDTEEKAFLLSVSSKEGSSKYNELILQKGLKLQDILNICSTCKPSLALLLEYSPRLLPRPYSFANSPLENNKEITIIYSMLNDNPGITTEMLTTKSLNDEDSSFVLMYMREPNLFRYTENDFTKNQILIAVGTAIAPFLGFLQHKQHLFNQSGRTNKPGQTWLFAGTTTEESMIHQSQLKQWQHNNFILNLFESYSRDENSRYRYVQDAIIGNAKDFVNLLLCKDTVLYLCADGGGDISKSIEAAVIKCLENELQVPNDEALQMLKEFKTNAKYREDLWL